MVHPGVDASVLATRIVRVGAGTNVLAGRFVRIRIGTSVLVTRTLRAGLGANDPNVQSGQVLAQRVASLRSN